MRLNLNNHFWTPLWSVLPLLMGFSISVMMSHTWSPVYVFDPSTFCTLLFPGGPCPRDPAGTQHRIQKDYKPGRGRTIALNLSFFVGHPSFSFTLFCFSHLHTRAHSFISLSWSTTYSPFFTPRHVPSIWAGGAANYLQKHAPIKIVPLQIIAPSLFLIMWLSH